VLGPRDRQPRLPTDSALLADVLRLWRIFPDPEPVTEDTAKLRRRAEHLLEWLMANPGQDAPCTCSSLWNPADGPPRPACLRHAAGPRKLDRHGQPISRIIEARIKVDLGVKLIAPFVHWLNDQARCDPPKIRVEVTDGFRRLMADHAAIDNLDALAHRVWVAGVECRIARIKLVQSSRPHLQVVVDWLRAYADAHGKNGAPLKLKQNDKDLRQQCRTETNASWAQVTDAIKNLPPEYKHKLGNPGKIERLI